MGRGRERPWGAGGHEEGGRDHGGQVVMKREVETMGGRWS